MYGQPRVGNEPHDAERGARRRIGRQRAPVEREDGSHLRPLPLGGGGQGPFGAQRESGR
jgi:hypothetical protein